MAVPVPVAEGSLASTPFAHVLLSIHRKKMSGTLAIWPDDGRKGQDRVRFVAGLPNASRLLEPAETLERGLLPLFRRESPYAFFEADLVGDDASVVGGTCELGALLAAGLRGGVRDDVIDKVLADFGSQPVRVAPGFDVRAHRLLPKELAYLDVIGDAPATMATLQTSGGDEKTARRMLYLVAITGHLERFRASIAGFDEGLPTLESLPPPKPPSGSAPRPVPAAPPSGAPARSSASAPRPERKKARGIPGPEVPPAPPPGLAPELAARWQQLAAAFVASDEQTYFDFLGVPESASPDEIRKAYVEQVKRSHPDRLPPELAPIRPFAERLFQLATEAKEHLEDDEKRMKYVRNVKSGGGTPASDRRMMVVLAAAHELEKATVLSNLGKWGELLDVLDDARTYDPTQIDIYALEAWGLFNLLGQRPDATLDRVLALTERVLLEAPKNYHERAAYTRGLALKKQGKDELAVDLFRRVAAANPRNLDAAREVRLFEMRQKSAAERASKLPEEGGLFSKLFGGKKPGS